MGGQYRITGDKYPRMRRNQGRRRLVLAVVASVAALGLVGWGTLQLIDVFTGGGDKASAAAAAAAAGCGRSPSPSASPVKAVPKPGQITVNVLNATSRTGLAKDTADALKKRGFRIGEVGNASKAYDKKVEGPGVVLGAKAAADTALTVLATQVTGAEKKTDSRVKPAEVDLILGKAFKALAPEKAADRALTVLSDPAPAPSPRKKNC
ncbi:LytR C-terminal domain-containing protein [Streptomyces sp. 8P21H-1]|nr:LytR C-terminal domain-containing protein [Streptomyces sp. 8P21H-1]